MIHDQIMKELKQIPEQKMSELYDIIHYFRLGLQAQQERKNPTMSLAGAWSDMSEEAFTSMLEDIGERRKRAFSRRRSNGAEPD